MLKLLNSLIFIVFSTNLLALDCNTLQYGSWIEVPADESIGQDKFCVMKFEAKEQDKLPTSQPIGNG